MENRQTEIHDKGFNMNQTRIADTDLPITYGKIKVGVKNLDDAVLDLGSFKKGHVCFGNKGFIMQALYNRDLPLLREISNYFYDASGIYSKTCDYVSNLYRYDWYVVPHIYDKTNANPDKIVKDFDDILEYLDNTHIKKMCGDIASKVVREGAYYGYLVDCGDRLMLQELPINYCRSRFNVGDNPAIEFDMRFFDEKFPDLTYRMKILKMFPQEFQKGYVLYKQRKLPADFQGDTAGCWYLLDPECTVKFCLNNGDMPMFVNTIPYILDLDAAQDLDRRKQMQKLLKIVVQKLPLDKNGDLIFDIDEAKDLHNNAVEMLKRAVGVDVLTTFADIDAIDMSDRATTTTKDDLEKVERTVFNEMGISHNLFNTDGNMALDKSILNDEASVRSLLLQFHIFFNRITRDKNVKNRKKYSFKFYMLETTQYNYKDLSKMYKEHVQIGYSKMLPQIALGQSQSFILNAANFENNILKLNEIMIPPLMSSTLNGEDILGQKNQTTTSKTQQKVETVKTDSKEAGRPEKPDDQKSDKTIKNKEAMS